MHHHCGPLLNLSVAERNSSCCWRISSSSLRPLASIFDCFFSRFYDALATPLSHYT
jgi:hypothetical protein